jgi:hypothetical protein
MRLVRYVGLGEDERHLLVETVEGDEKFSLYVTDELRQAASIDLPRLLHAQRQIENPITPREIQMRVRAGESPEEIADQAGMPLQRVLRFASAVVAERERITGEARNGRARRNTPDGEFVIFGSHVDSRFTAHGIEPNTVSWDSYRNEEGAWVVSAGWHGGDLKRVARWTFALATRTVTPIDETAADLLSDRPIRPVVHVVYDMPISNPSESPTGPIPGPGLRDELFNQNAPVHEIHRDYSGHGADNRHDADGPGRGQSNDFAEFSQFDPSPWPVDAPTSIGRMFEREDERADRHDSEHHDSGRPDQITTDYSALTSVNNNYDETSRYQNYETQNYETSSDSRGRSPDGARSNYETDTNRYETDNSQSEPAAVLPLRGLPDPLPLVPGFEESDDDHAARARIPSWDDILLGVRRKRD